MFVRLHLERDLANLKQCCSLRLRHYKCNNSQVIVPLLSFCLVFLVCSGLFPNPYYPHINVRHLESLMTHGGLMADSDSDVKTKHPVLLFPSVVLIQAHGHLQGGTHYCCHYKPISIRHYK